jgi:hypothetical protein
MTRHEFEKSSNYPLPSVSEETIRVALQDLEEQGHTKYLGGAFESLLGNNPYAATSILGFIEGVAETEHEEFVAQQAIALLHELLRKQAAASQLDDSIEQ